MAVATILPETDEIDSDLQHLGSSETFTNNINLLVITICIPSGNHNFGPTNFAGSSFGVVQLATSSCRLPTTGDLRYDAPSVRWYIESRDFLSVAKFCAISRRFLRRLTAGCGLFQAEARLNKIRLIASLPSSSLIGTARQLCVLAFRFFAAVVSVLSGGAVIRVCELATFGVSLLRNNTMRYLFKLFSKPECR